MVLANWEVKGLVRGQYKEKFEASSTNQRAVKVGCFSYRRQPLCIPAFRRTRRLPSQGQRQLGEVTGSHNRDRLPMHGEASSGICVSNYTVGG
jgi:hypothetical protein